MSLKHGRLHYEESTDLRLENRTLRRIFGRAREKNQGAEDNCTMRRFIIFSVHIRVVDLIRMR
jgi:hypothetical protein